MLRFCAFLAVSVLPLKAGTSGDWEYQVLNDPVYGELNGGAVIFAYTGPGGAVVIPDSFNGVPVKRIGAQGGVFLNNLQNITSITVPHGTIWIGDQAFANCVNLTEVILPNTLKHIGVGAFGNCTNLTNITLPNSLEILGDAAFAGCTSLRSISIPANVTSIAQSTFDGCYRLYVITIPDGFVLPELPGLNATIINSDLINALTSNDAFVTAVANKIRGTIGNYGIATQEGISNTITTLATKTELTNALTESRTDGINSVISNPNLWTLYTTNQIKAMVMGDLMLTRTNNGQFVLNYDIEQSDDLANWSPYQGFALPLTNLPTDKAFVRIKLKNQQ